jgi:ComEC/Rec2-related protein
MISAAIAFMALILVASLVSLMLHTFEVPHLLANWSEHLQQICLSNRPNSIYRFWYAGIVCGTSVRHEPAYPQVTAMGLIHLIVVSGSHLVFIETLSRPFTECSGRFKKKAEIVIGIGLGFYVVATGLQSPALRSWFFWLFRLGNRQLKLHWTNVWATFFSIPLTLIWTQTSISLALSWCAALALHVPLDKESLLRRSTIVYLATAPILCFFAPPAPVTILFNASIGPLLGFILFPASLLSYLIPPLVEITDKMWSLLFLIANEAAPPITTHFRTSLSINFFAMSYALLFQICCVFLERRPNCKPDLFMSSP